MDMYFQLKYLHLKTKIDKFICQKVAIMQFCKNHFK